MSSRYATKRIGDVLSLEYGKPLPQSERVPISGIPAYGANGVLCWSRKAYRDDPSIIVGRKGSAGEVTITDGPYWPTDVTYFVEHDTDVTNLRYLYHLLKFLQLPKLAKGVKPGINRNDIYNLKAPIPTLDEQTRIVDFLDNAFDGIAKAIANAESNLTNARALFESELTTLVLQQDQHTQNFHLMDVCSEFGRGKSRHRPRNEPKLYGGPYPFIQTGDLTGARHFIENYSQTYTEFGLSQSKLWPKGTVCIAIVGATIGESGILGFDACFPDSVIGMIADPLKTDCRYLQYLLDAYKAIIKSKGVGSARENINLATFETQLFPFPSIKRQRQIVKLLGDISENSEHLIGLQEQKIGLLEELKMSLLAGALSGRLISAEDIAA